MRLSAHDLQRYNRTVGDLFAASWAGLLSEHAPRLLLQLIPGELGLCHFFPRSGGATVIWNHPVVPRRREYLRIFNEYSHQHPWLGRRRAARSLSDGVAQQTWRRTTLFGEVIGAIGGEDDLGLDITLGKGSSMSCAILRPGWRFRDEERSLLNLLRPHLQQAWRQQLPAGGAGSEALAASLEPLLGRGLLIANGAGRMDSLSDQARRLLDPYVRESWPRTHLPEPLRAWFQELADAWRSGRMGEQPARPLDLEREGGRLRVQFAGPAGPDAFCLMLEEKRVEKPALLRPLGLSEREQEVLFCVMGGASNKVVAQRLEISPHTVKRHLERIFAHLRVTSRHEAAERARRCLRRVDSA